MTDKQLSSEDTIVARATPPGGAIRGILRLSGPKSVESLNVLLGLHTDNGSRIRLVSDCPLVESVNLYPWLTADHWASNDSTEDERSQKSKRPIPAKLFYWPEGRGYTGQQSVEIHTIGSPPILEALIDAICRDDLVRLARPGEFTLRAFLSGRLDLTQAEAVLGVIEAVDRKSLETALGQLAGNLASPLKHLREELFETLAHIEAGLDFADEDIEFISSTEIRKILSDVLNEVESLRHRMEDRGILSEKPLVVLVGAPNAGKSTLFNRLLETDRAIVSPIAGTTRDYIEVETEFDGRPCRLIDTAGLDHDGKFTNLKNETDQKAQRLSISLFDQADLLLYCQDWQDAESVEQGGKTIDFERFPLKRTIFLKTKVDAETDPDCIAGTLEDRTGQENRACRLSVSAKTGRGIELLKQKIARRLDALRQDDDVMPGTAIRCRNDLSFAAQSLRRALDGLNGCEFVFDETLLADEIRRTVNALGLIDGSVHTEDLLDSIFSRFCIGK